MAIINTGGRPKNSWTSSRMRKLTRLHLLSNTKVERIPQILNQENGFTTCLRDVHTQLSTINPKTTHSSRRRRRKIMARDQLKTICKELKPRIVPSNINKGRKIDIASQATECLLDTEVVDDGLYNPLAHWDYFSDLETPCVSLEQIMIGNSDPIRKANAEEPEVLGEVKTLEGKRDIRKRQLCGIIASSELSFVVSLLSSRWSKSALNTRALSHASSTGWFCDGLWDLSSPSSTDLVASRPYPYGSKSVSAVNRFSIAPGWRPCCTMSYALGNSHWICPTCGSSATLYGSKYSFRHEMRAIEQHTQITEASLASELLEHIEDDPMFSLDDDSMILDTGSATMEFLESSIQAAISNQLIEEQYDNPNQCNNLKREQCSELILAQDRFGNTALHHASAIQSFDHVLRLIEIGVPVETINSSGQTFLHLLNPSLDVDKYVMILRCTLSQSPSFPICHRDNYGLSILQAFLICTENAGIPAEQWSEVTSYLGNQGFGGNRGDFYGEDLELNFSTRFSSLPPERWVDGDVDLAIELDRNGDTCLIALVKTWPEKEDAEILLRLINHLARDREPKANVNACDRNERTALFFTAGRGNRAATELLLDLGANPNSRSWDFKGKSTPASDTVLQWTEKQLNKAMKEEDQRLYAAILECQKCLVLAGAKLIAEVMDEFGIRGR